LHPKFKPNTPATEKAIVDLTNALPKTLPKAYWKIMALANGGEGFVGDKYVELWPVEELVKLNKKHQVAKNAPDLFAIGSNGKGEAYAFDVAKADGAVYQLAIAGMNPKDARLVAHSFDAFLPRINLFRQDFSSAHK
jgi:hypothetical protein